MRAILDTDVLIDVMKSNPDAIRYLGTLDPGHGMCSVVSLCELVTGLETGEVPAVQRFLSMFQVCDVTREIAHEAGRIRRRVGPRFLNVPDALIAATAILNHAVLVTRDQAYARVEGLEVVAP